MVTSLLLKLTMLTICDIFKSVSVVREFMAYIF